ncbi:hypothetical protein ACFQHO_04150 [Actinomadura yumaensis]|uniref:hypothetical protein n=1 Tax=Actinomadura yumaensis TaxID=111807 RepID=UPI00361A4C1E
MDAADDLLLRIGADRELSGFLAWPGDFDLERRDPVEDLRLPTGAPLAPIAGDGAGGTFFLCGEPGTARPVLYADSEGGAALIAADLAEALALIAAHPYWRDLGNGHSPADLEAELIEHDPGYPARRDRALALLGAVPRPPRRPSPGCGPARRAPFRTSGPSRGTRTPPGRTTPPTPSCSRTETASRTCRGTAAPHGLLAERLHPCRRPPQPVRRRGVLPARHAVPADRGRDRPPVHPRPQGVRRLAPGTACARRHGGRHGDGACSSPASATPDAPARLHFTTGYTLSPSGDPPL